MTAASARARTLVAAIAFIVGTLAGVLVLPMARATAAAPHILARLNAFTAPDGSTVVGLFFDNSAPEYRLSGAGTPNVDVLLLNSAKRAPVPTNIPSVGALRSGDVASRGDDLDLRFVVSRGSVAHVVNSYDGRSITIAFTAPRTDNVLEQPAAEPTSPPPPAAQRREVVFLKYADVSEIAGLISSVAVAPNDNFSPSSSTFGYVQAGYGFNGGSPASPLQASSVSIASAGGTTALAQVVTPQVAIDRRLNAVVLSGSDAEIASLKDLIEMVDVPLPSVLLETQILELTQTAAADLGVDYSANGALASVTMLSQSFNEPQAAANLRASIYARMAKGGGRVLATPRVLAESGHSASILTGDAIPIISNITYPGSTTPVVQQEIQYVNVGVSLQIQPRITDDGYVNTHVYAAISSVSAYVQNIPQISQRLTTTTATVKDGETFAIGGLLQQSEITNMEKVPLFGDLPLIGTFFRASHRSSTNTNLYILITPRIVSGHRGAGADNRAPRL